MIDLNCTLFICSSLLLYGCFIDVVMHSGLVLELLEVLVFGLVYDVFVSI